MRILIIKILSANGMVTVTTTKITRRKKERANLGFGP